MLAIINDAARAYRGVIPADRWHEPYMAQDELAAEIAHGVSFWVAEREGRVSGLMGIQDKGDVALVRHAYVASNAQRSGVGTTLLRHVESLVDMPILIGTWAAASWAVEFYRRNGFTVVSNADKESLLRKYWSIPPRQIETSVVLANRQWLDAPVGRSHESSRVVVSNLSPADRGPWETLARGYKDFYKTPTPDAEYDTTWARLVSQDGVFALGAKVDGELVGIAHFLFHTAVWAPKVCYLQDLFTAPSARGKGVARALIDAVARAARAQGATRYYWMTQADNAVARALYDKVATHHGFIRYEYALARKM